MIFLLLSGIKSFPAIGLFRNGHFLEFEDEADDEKAVLRWMTAEDTLKGAVIYDVLFSLDVWNTLSPIFLQLPCICLLQTLENNGNP